MGTTNQINANTAGIVTYDGAGTFSADTTTNHNVLVGAPTNGITNVAPSATSGIALVSAGSSSDPQFSTTVVAGGGTGLTTLTPYTLLAGGTTSTGNVQQVASVGTAGQALISNGAGSLPTFQTIPAAGIQTLTDGSANVVSPSGGTITFVNGQNVANLSGSANHITFDVTGTTNHAVQVGNASGNLTSIGTGTSGQPLLSAGASSDPAYGDLSVAHGGTGATTLTGVLIGNGTSAVTASTVTQYGTVIAGASNTVSSVAPGAEGTVLASNGVSANPSYQTIPGVGTTVTQHYALVGGATNNIVSVSPSTAGYVLTSNGISSDPSFQPVALSVVWTDATASSYTLESKNGYITDNAGGVSYTLPSSALLGDTIYIVGKLGLSTIVPNSGQQIVIGSASGTVGTSGTAVSTNAGDSITLVCITAGSNCVFRASNFVGNWTLS